MDEVHEGFCFAHQGVNTLSRKIVLQRYYWLSMVHDCISKVLTWDVYQKFAKKETCPTTFYKLVNTAILFARWGMDILGPLSQEPSWVKFCIVAIDYFTKWVEASPLATIS